MLHFWYLCIFRIPSCTTESYVARTPSVISFTLNWRWDCDMVVMFMVCVCEKDVILFLHFLMQWVWERNHYCTRPQSWVYNTLFLFFLSLPIHLLLSKCEISICSVSLLDFSGSFHFKMHCIIFVHSPIISLPYLFSCIVLYESDSQPGVLVGQWLPTV